MTKFLIGSSLVLCCAVSAADELDSILTQDIPGQVSMICDLLSRNASPLADKSIDLIVEQTGMVETPQDGAFGINLDAEMREPSIWAGTHKLRLVTSRTHGYAETRIPSSDSGYFARNIGTVSAKDSRRITFNEQDQVKQVVVYAAPVSASLDFITYLHTTNASCWRDSGGPRSTRLANQDSFNNMLRNKNFVHSEIENIEGLGRILALTDEKIGRDDEPNFHSIVKFYFGMVHGIFVFLGDDTTNRSMSSGYRTERRLSYAPCEGHLLPKVWTHSCRRERLDAEMQPIGTPHCVRDVRYKVISCQILEEFPTNVLDITIPASARFVDTSKRTRSPK